MKLNSYIWQYIEYQPILLTFLFFFFFKFCLNLCPWDTISDMSCVFWLYPLAPRSMVMEMQSSASWSSCSPLTYLSHYRRSSVSLRWRSVSLKILTTFWRLRVPLPLTWGGPTCVLASSVWRYAERTSGVRLWDPVGHVMSGSKIQGTGHAVHCQHSYDCLWRDVCVCTIVTCTCFFMQQDMQYLRQFFSHMTHRTLSVKQTAAGLIRSNPPFMCEWCRTSFLSRRLRAMPLNMKLVALNIWPRWSIAEF